MNGGEVSAASRCANCGEPLSGRYCAACGQRYEPHIHSLREFMSEATESLTHADSRLWRTLRLLLAKPGFLTKEFFAGRRAQYLPPFRLYLVLSVVFFIVAASGREGARFVQVSTTDRGVPVAAHVTPLDRNPENPSETQEQRVHRLCDNIVYSGPGEKWIMPRLREGCRKIVADNGREAGQALYHNVPRALIVLLPVLALLMRAMYWRRHYVEHLLFFVHTHAFAFLFLTAYLLAVRWVDAGWWVGLATLATVALIPFHTYRAMRRVYEQGRWVTRAKFVALAFAYVVLLTTMMAITSLYTVITL